MTLGAAFRRFVGKPTPRLLGGAVAVLLVVRIALGDFGWADVAVAAGILAAEPFTEWLIHVFLLHWRPKKIGRITLDPLVARKHRAHHAAPRDLDILFVPLPVIWLSPVLGIGLPLLLAPTLAVAASASLTAYAMLLTYEWTHFLIHTPYRPRRWPYRSIARAHRLHHYRNEHYWFGVTMHLADRVLRTYPDRDAVELSATARRILSEPDADSSSNRPLSIAGR